MDPSTYSSKEASAKDPKAHDVDPPTGSWSHRGTLGFAVGHPGTGSQQHYVLIQVSYSRCMRED
jgi:hypothetical protein